MKKKDYPIVSFTSSSLRCAQKYSTNIYLNQFHEKNFVKLISRKNEKCHRRQPTMERLFEQIGIFVTRTFQCEKY